MEISNIIGLLGGLALFIFGMNLMGDGLKQVAGSALKRILEKLTTNRIVGMLVGTALTALIQSSNAMCVMVVGFVNASMMSLERSVGVLMGSKIGTTVTGQLIAFNITEIAPVIAFIGVGITMVTKKKKPRYVGQIIASLGVLFIGLGMMSKSMEPLKDLVWFREILEKLSNPLLAVLVGIIFTVIVQSASASVGVLQVMAASKIIGFRPAFFVMIGMNIGASVAPVLASIGGRKDAKRCAVIVVLLHTIGLALFLILAQVCPVLDWIAGTAGDPSRQIANANTIFNVVTVLVLLPFTRQVANLSRKIIPGNDSEQGLQLLYIKGASAQQTPAVLLEQIDAEVKRMEQLVRTNLVNATETYFSDKLCDRTGFDENEETIDFLNKGITDALIRVNMMDASIEEAKHAGNLFHVISDLERIGDHAENMVTYSNRMVEEKSKFSPAAEQELRELVDMVYEIYDESCRQLFSPDQDTYNTIYQLEDSIDDAVDNMKNQHIVRLSDMTCNSKQGMYFVETLTDLERAADHCLNIAQAAKVRYHHTIEPKHTHA